MSPTMFLLVLAAFLISDLAVEFLCYPSAGKSLVLCVFSLSLLFKLKALALGTS